MVFPVRQYSGNSSQEERSVRYVHVQLDQGYNFILVRLLQGAERYGLVICLFQLSAGKYRKEWKKPRLHALLVGVSNYSDPALCLCMHLRMLSICQWSFSGRKEALP